MDDAFLPAPGESSRWGQSCSTASGPGQGQLLPASWFRGEAHGESVDKTKGERGQSIDNHQVCTWVSEGSRHVQVVFRRSLQIF